MAELPPEVWAAVTLSILGVALCLSAFYVLRHLRRQELRLIEARLRREEQERMQEMSASAFWGDQGAVTESCLESLRRISAKGVEGVEDEVCTICLEELVVDNEEFFVSPTCYHKFHLSCIGKWACFRRDASCPNCLREMAEEGDFLQPLPLESV